MLDCSGLVYLIIVLFLNFILKKKDRVFVSKCCVLFFKHIKTLCFFIIISQNMRLLIFLSY